MTKEDYTVLIPYFENLISQSGQVNLLCDMSDCEGMEVEAFWEDFKFGIRHLRDFQRMAIVGDQRWMEWLANIFNPLVKTDVKCFSPEQMAEVWAWLRA